MPQFTKANENNGVAEKEQAPVKETAPNLHNPYLSALKDYDSAKTFTIQNVGALHQPIFLFMLERLEHIENAVNQLTKQ